MGKKVYWQYVHELKLSSIFLITTSEFKPCSVRLQIQLPPEFIELEDSTFTITEEIESCKCKVDVLAIEVLSVIISWCNIPESIWVVGRHKSSGRPMKTRLHNFLWTGTRLLHLLSSLISKQILPTNELIFRITIT